MKILIIGAGQVGSNIAEYLASDGNDVTVIDVASHRLNNLRDRLDIKTIEGHGAHPAILEQAGIADTDMLIAVTMHDEINMMACQIAYSLFKTPKKIARIRAEGYSRDSVRELLFKPSHVPVDVVITPEQLVTDHIVRLINQPGALQILDFADGLIKLVGIRASANAPMLGHELRALKEHMPSIDCRVAAIYRDGSPIMPDADTVIHVNDDVFCLADGQHIREVMSEMAKLEKPYKRIMIAGGGNIGLRLARALENNYSVKIIEFNDNRCQQLATELNSTIVLNGTAANQELLLEEAIETVDVFIAVTNDDAANIIASMLAKRLGAGKVITIINDSTYAELMDGSVIDIAVSPQQITTSALLADVRRADTVKAYPLRRNAAEAVEMIVRGDKDSSKLVGRRVRDIELPVGAGIGAVKRNGPDGNQILMGHSDLVIHENDHVVVFTIDRSNLKQIERLFQVRMSFF